VLHSANLRHGVVKLNYLAIRGDLTLSSECPHLRVLDEDYVILAGALDLLRSPAKYHKNNVGPFPHKQRHPAELPPQYIAHVVDDGRETNLGAFRTFRELLDWGAALQAMSPNDRRVQYADASLGARGIDVVIHDFVPVIVVGSVSCLHLPDLASYAGESASAAERERFWTERLFGRLAKEEDPHLKAIRLKIQDEAGIILHRLSCDHPCFYPP